VVIPGYKAMLERQQQMRRRVAVELLRVANNSLGSYGMYLHAFHATRERFDFYIFCEDDYLPSRSHFDTALVRLYRRAFPSSPVTSPTATAEAATARAATAEGVLAGVLQGRPIEPKNRWRLHLETSHIMSARALDVLSRRTYAEGRAFRGSLTDRMLMLAGKQRIRDSYQFGAIQGAFGLLLADAGLPIREWTGSFRSPYWDHANGVVDWSGAAANFSVPPGRTLFVPVQWLFEPHVISSCLPAGPPPRSWKEGIDACRLPMHAGTLLRRDGHMCGCDVATTAYRHLVELRAPHAVRGVEDGVDAAAGGGQAASEREKRQRTRMYRVGTCRRTRDHSVNLTDVLADAIMAANLSRGPRRTGNADDLRLWARAGPQSWPAPGATAAVQVPASVPVQLVVNCTTAVAPVDPSPVRSPQAVHTALLPRMAGRTVYEIGSRKGDSIACFTRVARRATAVELDKSACRFLEPRAKEVGFELLCADYRNSGLRDAQVFTWWQEPPELSNFAVLAELRRLLDQGVVSPGAVALLSFDQKQGYDVKDMKELRDVRRWTTWTVDVPFDEHAACLASKHPEITRQRSLCRRAKGHFVVAEVPIAAVTNMT
jgi:hypothetical protein